jgi:hypothetical protein
VTLSGGLLVTPQKENGLCVIKSPPPEDSKSSNVGQLSVMGGSPGEPKPLVVLQVGATM